VKRLLDIITEPDNTITNMNATTHAKKAAMQAAKHYGVTVEYEVGDMRWTANVCAPDGMVFDGGETSLVTSWLTKPDDRFWLAVHADIVQMAPYMIPT
jgi:hypothetical protein